MNEYEACIHELEDALEMKIRKLEVFGDSILIIYQVKGEWKIKDEKLRPYQEYLSKLAEDFDKINGGICTTYTNGHMMTRQMQTNGYFFMTIEKDCIQFVRKYHKCHVYSDKINAPHMPI